jgi:hypothetical protein
MTCVPTLFAMKPKGRPSPSMIVALLALFVPLGGASMAATGGNFHPGEANQADRTTGLSGSTLPDAAACLAPCEALQVSDSSTAANAGGLGVLGNTATTPAATVQNIGGEFALSLLVSAGRAPGCLPRPLGRYRQPGRPVHDCPSIGERVGAETLLGLLTPKFYE